jgi:hypothetical protein
MEYARDPPYGQLDPTLDIWGQMAMVKTTKTRNFERIVGIRSQGDTCTPVW